MLAAFNLAVPHALPNLDAESRSPGKERDSETGLDYFGARYYGSAMGRFLSLGALPFAIFEGWVTTLLALTRFNVFGQSLIFTSPASAQAYHR